MPVLFLIDCYRGIGQGLFRDPCRSFCLTDLEKYFLCRDYPVTYIPVLTPYQRLRTNRVRMGRNESALKTEPILFFRVMRRLESLRDEMRLVFEFVGSVDTAFSVLSLRQGLHIWCTPVVTDPVKAFQAKSIYHPLIEKCVPNDIGIRDRSVLLTGSNMSGKTSFIRTIGVITIRGGAYY